MANLSPEELNARAQQVFSDPRVAQAWAAWNNYHDRTGVWNPGHGVVGYAADFDHAVRATGLMPDGYQVGYDGPGGSPTLKHKGLPSWIYPLAAAGIAATAGAATGAFGAAAGGAAASGGGAAAGGGYIGADVASTAAAALGPTAAVTGGAGLTSTLMRYGLPAVAGFAENYVNQKNENNRTNQAIALKETELDPFRGTMHQAADVAKLERQANGPLYETPPSSSPYSSYINPANRPPALSPTMVNTTRNAQDLVSKGQGTVPTMTDSHNWGKTGTQDLSTPWQPATTTPAPYQPTPPAGTLPPPLPATPTTSLAGASAPSSQGLSYFQRMLLNARRRGAPVA